MIAGRSRAREETSKLLTRRAIIRILSIALMFTLLSREALHASADAPVDVSSDARVLGILIQEHVGKLGVNYPIEASELTVEDSAAFVLEAVEKALNSFVVQRGTLGLRNAEIHVSLDGGTLRVQMTRPHRAFCLREVCDLPSITHPCECAVHIDPSEQARAEDEFDTQYDKLSRVEQALPAASIFAFAGTPPKILVSWDAITGDGAAQAIEPFDVEMVSGEEEISLERAWGSLIKVVRQMRLGISSHGKMKDRHGYELQTAPEPSEDAHWRYAKHFDISLYESYAIRPHSNTQHLTIEVKRFVLKRKDLESFSVYRDELGMEASLACEILRELKPSVAAERGC